MSEYQYYEFVAVDGPISDEGLRYAQSCSTRAQVSRLHWRNVYHFGSFKGSVDQLLQYYDAHFYIANWGSVCFALSFPKGTLHMESIEPYVSEASGYENSLTVSSAGEREIVSWERHEEGKWDWTEGEGIIDCLVGIREELLRGDYRALFIGWLGGFYPEEWQDSVDTESKLPPIPANLGELSVSEKEMLNHFTVDVDVLSVAVSLSNQYKPERIPLADVIDSLSSEDMKEMLVKVAGGEGRQVMADLQRMTYREETVRDFEQQLSCAMFAEQVLEARQARIAEEEKLAEARRKQDAEKRKQHLANIMQKADVIWTGLASLMDEKNAAAYDQVARQLEELQAAHQQAGKNESFQAKLTAFREQYVRRPAMMRRIAGL